MSDEPIREQAAPSASMGEYLVVARRYRPMAFDELVGQHHVAAALSNAIETGRVGHAYLFTGARGVGKTSAARILAKALNCVSGPTSTPCNACDICQSIASGDDVDVLEIDGASNRGIDEIRQLRQNAGVRPSRARLKIYIIDEVHMLTKEAFNALLKTLEEPPEHVKFIFATTEPNKIPVTILSRCQRFDFAGIDAAAIEKRLTEIASAEGITIEPEALQIIARRAAGSMRDGQSLLEQLLSLDRKQITPQDVHALLGTSSEARVSKLIERLVERDAPGALAQLDHALAQGVEVQQLMDQLLAYYRDVMAAVVGCSQTEWLHVTKSEAPTVESLGQRLGIETVLASMQILEQTATRMRLSTHDRTLAEMAIVRIANLEDLDNLSALIEGLHGIEAGTPSAGGRSAPPPAGRAPAPSKKNGGPQAEPSPTSAETVGQTPSGVVSPQSKLSAETAASVWQGVLDGLDGMVSDQAAMFEDVAISAPNRLVVRFPAKYTSCRQFCERPEQKAILREALSKATGEPIELEFAAVGNTSTADVSPQTRTVGMRQMQAEVIGRPIVRRAMELFEVPRPRIDFPQS